MAGEGPFLSFWTKKIIVENAGPVARVARVARGMESNKYNALGSLDLV
jgi:hypothetical protein